MGSMHSQWEREGRKQGEKEANTERSLNLFFFFSPFYVHFSHAVFSCISLSPISTLNRVPVTPALLGTSASRGRGELGALPEASPTAVPGPLQMFASCRSGAVRGRQLSVPGGCAAADSAPLC